jgi:REP element-mobilizing transposase RayT
MSQSFVSLLYHFVWSTWDRSPLVTPGVEPVVFACIRAKCVELGALPLALGGADDHVHLFVSAPPTLAPAALVGSVKGAAARWANQRSDLSSPLRWQGGYSVFSVSRWDEARVAKYVSNQRVHHRDNTLDLKLEAFHGEPREEACEGRP